MRPLFGLVGTMVFTAVVVISMIYFVENYTPSGRGEIQSSLLECGDRTVYGRVSSASPLYRYSIDGVNWKAIPMTECTHNEKWEWVSKDKTYENMK